MRAACTAVSEKPGRAYNPLFIHGSCGLGKTHLLQATCQDILRRQPYARILYLSCDTFINHFMECVQNGDMSEFRFRYRHVDVLVIDDIHFLSRGQMVKTKEELFSTFNQLNEQGKKVVITSDAPPADIKYLEERFIQRFSGGLVIALEKPDPALRREVVLAKAKAQGVTLGDEVTAYVVDHITDNIRELEGAVNKLVAFAASFQRRIGSCTRAWKRCSCSSSETENQYLISWMSERTSMCSNSGQERMNSSYWCSSQKPITRSTPARLYQERSKMTISPAAGR